MYEPVYEKHIVAGKVVSEYLGVNVFDGRTGQIGPEPDDSEIARQATRQREAPNLAPYRNGELLQPHDLQPKPIVSKSDTERTQHAPCDECGRALLPSDIRKRFRRCAVCRGVASLCSCGQVMSKLDSRYGYEVCKACRDAARKKETEAA